MKKFLFIAIALAGCVDGLQPAEVGMGRRVGTGDVQGDVSAVLPPMTDRSGNIYVVSGEPDSTGIPQPGTFWVGDSQGEWTQGCLTGEGIRGGALGWIGATSDRGWLWTGTQIVEVIPDYANWSEVGEISLCRSKLDVDTVSQADIFYKAVAPFVDETVSGDFAVGAITLGATPTVYLSTFQLDIGDFGVVTNSLALGDVDVLATGANPSTREAAFLVRDAAGPRIVIAKPNAKSLTTILVNGTLPTTTLISQLTFASDGSIAAVLDDHTVLVGNRSGVTVSPAPFTARGIETDDDGNAHLIGVASDVAQVATIHEGLLGVGQEWSVAMSVEAQLAAGVVVVDYLSGSRDAHRWQTHAAAGGISLVQRYHAPAYAVGARAVLVANPAVDRGGVKYSQLAVVPVGVELP
ncbi:MAG TPA: hypothetical protein VGM90_07930 [Kofleriaceae bacterium]